MFQATIYRTSAQCGITGAPSRTMQGAIDAARIKAGRLFVLGISATTAEKWGYDATSFLEEAEKRCKSMMFRKRNCPMVAVRDGSSDVTLELNRLQPWQKSPQTDL